MKKLFLVLLFVPLLFFNTSAAEKIDPMDNIGIFVDPDIFDAALRDTPIFDQVTYSGIREYPYDSELIKYIIDYEVYEGEVTIRCWEDYRGKILGIKIYIAPWYLLRDDCFEGYQIVGFVLLASGLFIGDGDLEAIEAMKNNEESFLSPNYYIKRAIEDDDLTFQISSYYDGDHRYNNPYRRMMLYDDLDCDRNYLGACITVSSKDLDCSDVPFRNFYVTGTDVHGFDGDGNGVCCEPYPIQ